MCAAYRGGLKKKKDGIFVLYIQTFGSKAACVSQAICQDAGHGCIALCIRMDTVRRIVRANGFSVREAQGGKVIDVLETVFRTQACLLYTSLNRLADGFVLVRNPMNFHQVSRVPLSPETVDCIVFWTKDPAPMLAQLYRLEPYPYYIQFTVNPYGGETERALPPKKTLLDTFRRLAERIGPERMVWRYSPILISADYMAERHLEFFGETARALRGYTKQCKMSLLDLYPKIRKRMAACGVTAAGQSGGEALALRLAEEGRPVSYTHLPEAAVLC